MAEASSRNDRGLDTEVLPLEAPPDAVFTRLQATLAAQKPSESPLRPPRLWRATLLALPGIALGTLVLDALIRGRGLVRADFGHVLTICLPAALAALLLALGSSALAASRGRDGLGERVPVLQLTTWLVAPLSVLPMLALVYSVPSRQGQGELLNPWGVPCSVIASVIALGALAVLVRELRHSVPVAVGWRSAALGSAAAAWSGLALLVHCTSVEPLHLLVGHWLPIAVFPLVAVLVARRYVRL
ncbi:MAG: NrsF family protein [Polyangiales bacterium]